MTSGPTSPVSQLQQQQDASLSHEAVNKSGGDVVTEDDGVERSQAVDHNIERMCPTPSSSLQDVSEDEGNNASHTRVVGSKGHQEGPQSRPGSTALHHTTAPTWALPENLPVRRQRNDNWTKAKAQELQRRYFRKGLEYKFSAERRKLEQTSGPGSGSALMTPGSPYHLNGTTMCILEALDAGIYFAYACFSLNQDATVLGQCIEFMDWVSEITRRECQHCTGEPRGVLYGLW
jgi:hypothetical protein